jgi:hypothetical protein
MTRLQATIRSIAYTSVTLALSCQAQLSENPSSAQHGTCAIALVNKDNIALIVDSQLTRMGSVDSCSAEYHGTGCKAVLVRNDVLLAITGIFNDPINGVDWKVSSETNRLLASLPQSIQVSDLNLFADSWFHILVSHFRAKPEMQLPRDREVSTLLIATRINGVPYIGDVVIRLDSNGRFTGYSDAIQMVSSSDTTPLLSYAGSCRDNVNTHPEGKYRPAVEPPNPLYRWELDEIGERKMNARSIEQFVSVLEDYEGVFARISAHKNQCWIGPPYDVATWEKGTSGWTTNFKAVCRPKTRQIGITGSTTDTRSPAR